MKVIYVSNACAPGTYESLYADAEHKSSEAVQKYHRVLAEGFALGERNEVVSVSVLPVNAGMPAGFYARKPERFHNVAYQYTAILNIPVVKQILTAIQVFWKVLKSSLSPGCMVICDTLCWTASMAAVTASRLTGTKAVGIVTDLPEFFAGTSKRKQSAFRRLLSMLDAYVFLTEQMNGRVNGTQKPYVVMEGQVDKREGERPHGHGGDGGGKICMYAGTLQKQYGLDLLVEGFLKADLKDWQLHLYGNGTYVEELEEICRLHENVRHFPSVPERVVVQKEKEADLLVNPRPTGEEYTKYSFPSKNMEYMASGTPVLTTRLPGMPGEYLEYVYTIEREDADGICRALCEAASVPEGERNALGRRAREFVLDKKNNQVQAAKITEMVNRMYEREGKDKPVEK